MAKLTIGLMVYGLASSLVLVSLLSGLLSQSQFSLVPLLRQIAIRTHPAAYTSSKGAVITLTKDLALELASQKIRVNCLNPVAAETPMLPSFLPEGTNLEEGKEGIISGIPLGRLAQPEDVAYAALYLASDEASMVSGVTLSVDGARGLH